jgi:murein DD-endopeptidase MepM/ murein hydrolase activator NlpD
MGQNFSLTKPGEVVTNRQKIGNLGTSGRSTGPDVHYEIVFNGVHQDPAKFLTARKHVFKD